MTYRAREWYRRNRGRDYSPSYVMVTYHVRCPSCGLTIRKKRVLTSIAKPYRYWWARGQSAYTQHECEGCGREVDAYAQCPDEGGSDRVEQGVAV